MFTLLCGASKGFMKALKTFIKYYEAPQRSVKIKIELNFYFNTTFRNAWDVKVNQVFLSITLNMYFYPNKHLPIQSQQWKH